MAARHFKYMDGDKGFASLKERIKQYQWTFLANMTIGSLLSWPLGTYVGNKLANSVGALESSS